MTYMSPLFFLFIFTLLISVHSFKLSFKPDGTFTVLQITDLHYEGNNETDPNNMKIQDKLIKRVKPDMVAVTGDVTSGWFGAGIDGWMEEIWKKFTKSFIDNETPYAFLMGNHDTQGDLDEDGIFQLEMHSKYSLLSTSQEGSYKNHNYYLPVYSGIDNKKVVALLWVFDSHSFGCEGQDSASGCVGSDQIEWYKLKSKELKKLYGDDIHQIAFVHIPLPEYIKLYNDYEFYGVRGEDTCSPSVNTNLFQAIKEEGVTALFVGHDHWNDYGGVIDGVELVYGRKTGYGCYGGTELGFQRGARVINLKEEKDENGKITVTREHHVIVENPEADTFHEEDVEVQKMLKKREGVEQDYSSIVDVRYIYKKKMIIIPLIALGFAFIMTFLGLCLRRLASKKLGEANQPKAAELVEEV